MNLYQKQKSPVLISNEHFEVAQKAQLVKLNHLAYKSVELVSFEALHFLSPEDELSFADCILSYSVYHIRTKQNG